MKKRIFALLLLLGALCGCGSGGTAEPLPALVIGSDDYAPYSYLDEDGTFAGFDVELAEEACRRLGYRAEFHTINWQEKDALLAAGEIDCLWGCFTMTGREARYCWAGPYAESRQRVAVRTESGVTELAGLDGKRVAVQVSSKPEELFLTRPTAEIPDVGAVYSFSSMAEVQAALRKGYVDAIAAHEAALRLFVDSMPDSIVMLPEPLYVSQLGVAFGLDSGNETLAAQLTEVLCELEAEGFTASLAEKYGLTQEDAP